MSSMGPCRNSQVVALNKVPCEVVRPTKLDELVHTWFPLSNTGGVSREILKDVIDTRTRDKVRLCVAQNLERTIGPRPGIRTHWR